MSRFDILCETNIPLSSYDSPDDFVIEHTATICHDGEAIGQVVLHKVLLGLACQYDQDLSAIFQTHSAELLAIHAALFDPTTDEFWADVERRFRPCGTDVLVIDAVVLDPQWRGQKLGLLALRRLIDLLGSDCALVVAHPRPLGKSVKAADRREGTAKLRLYLKQLGFRRVARTGFYALSTNLITPKFEDFLQQDAG